MGLAYGIVRSTVGLRNVGIYFCVLTGSAPIVKDVGVTYSLVRFQGSLLESNDFRLDAGPKVDAAWKSLGADCMSELLVSMRNNILISRNRFRGEDPCARSTALRSGARPSQDQRGVRWWISSACRGSSSSALPGECGSTCRMARIDKSIESAAKIAGMEFRLLQGARSRPILE
jgi:hypothetical protein